MSLIRPLRRVGTDSDRPAFFGYRLEGCGHSLSGLLCAASLQAYRARRIKPHESTRHDVEDGRVKWMAAQRVQTSPAMLVYPQAPAIDRLIGEALSFAVPAASVTTHDGVRHCIWPIVEPAAVEQLQLAFNGLPALYIADGHHRAAAAERVSMAHHLALGQSTDGDVWDGFLAAVFPHHSVRLLAYHRLIADLNGLSDARFLERLGARFEMTASSVPVRPSARGEMGLYLPGHWFRLRLRRSGSPGGASATRPDVRLLSEWVLEPILAIHDLRHDPRIECVGGNRDLEELAVRVDAGMAAAFTLYPAAVDEVMAAADRGEMLPPKSTWFEPKLADGLVAYEPEVERRAALRSTGNDAVGRPNA